MKFVYATVFAALVAGPAMAVDFRPAMESYLETEIRTWAEDPAIVGAIGAQNAVTGGYDQARVIDLDNAWRAEIGAAAMPTITPVLTGAAADFLRERVGASAGAITEIFIMDAQGLNVAASGLTSDYWQGDEAKFTETYGKGAGAVHFGEVEFDESSQTYQAQISVTVTDPATGQPIGAITVGVDAAHLM
ncbi:hypothetical protein [Salipiger sp.]|uniref:hypothetical protein n=1 Tax=Salipiger sp. TaxID=2078585 RepID=UPI003A971688